MHIADKDAKFCPHCGADLVKYKRELQIELLKKANETQPEPEPIVAEAIIEANNLHPDVPVINLDDLFDDDYEYAGFWIRALAMLIDVVLMQALYFILVAPLVAVLGILAVNISPYVAMQLGVTFALILAILLPWGWFTIGESSVWQGTPGKRLLGLKVIDDEDGRISFGKANKRYLGKIISTLLVFVGFLMVGLTAKKEGLHDKMVKTLVVKN
jgi:uncharacterized RDD family membrane protein YckC